VSSDTTVRVITDLFFRRGTRTFAMPSTAGSVQESDRVFASRGLRKFLSSLAPHETPTIVDLGPVVGQNVSFFGERLGCKIFVQDLYADVDRHIRENRPDALPEFLEQRLSQADGSVDGVLAWDLFDYLDRASAASLARQVTRILAPGGVLFGLFGTVKTSEVSYTKYVIRDEFKCERVGYRSATARQSVWQNREIIRMFEGLLVSDSFLLKINTREMLFRKPVSATEGPDAG
jgi:hypothetical protein